MSGKHIKIHEDSNGGIYTVGVTMKQVTSAKEVLYMDHIFSWRTLSRGGAGQPLKERNKATFEKLHL